MRYQLNHRYVNFIEGQNGTLWFAFGAHCALCLPLTKFGVLGLNLPAAPGLFLIAP